MGRSHPHGSVIKKAPEKLSPRPAKRTKGKLFLSFLLYLFIFFLILFFLFGLLLFHLLPKICQRTTLAAVTLLFYLVTAFLFLLSQWYSPCLFSLIP